MPMRVLVPPTDVLGNILVVLHEMMVFVMAHLRSARARCKIHGIFAPYNIMRYNTNHQGRRNRGGSCPLDFETVGGGRCCPQLSHRRTYFLFIIVTTSIKMCYVNVSQQLQSVLIHCPELIDFRTSLIISVLLRPFH